jgi:hypothetical protein
MSATGAATPGDKPTIEVLYTCGECKIVDRPVVVEERSVIEPVGAWLYRAAGAVYDDHRAASPACENNVISTMKIPTPPGTQAIGRAVRN